MTTETAPVRRRTVLSTGVAFWIIATVYAMFLFAASAPSPLYVVYQARWHFSAITLTTIFAVYVLALLAALVLAGSISDYVGRRPTLLVAATVQVAALVVFAVAPDVGWLAVARILQGTATGLATGALSAWLLDLQPAHRPRLGATTSSAAPSAGLALGAIGAGLLVQYAPAPTHLVYWLLAGLFAVAALTVFLLPETVDGGAVWWRALRPRVGVAAQSRRAFAAVAPCLIAVWALAGLFLSLGGSLTAGVLHSASHVLGGLAVMLLSGAGVVSTLVTTGVTPRTNMLAGCAGLIAGVAVALVGLHQGSSGLFFAGSALAGVGFGPAFAGAFRSVIATAPPTERAALVAAMFVVSYLAFSVPAVVAGIAVTHIGLLRTTTWYGVGVIALTVAAAVATWLRGGRSEAPAARTAPARTHCPACPGTVASALSDGSP